MGYATSIKNFISRLEGHLEEKLMVLEESSYYKITIPSSERNIFIYLPTQMQRLFPEDPKLIHVDVENLATQSENTILRLGSLLGKGKTYYARQTVVARVDKRVTTNFLAEHHMQGAMPGKYRYGLFYQGELISIAVFSGGRKILNTPDNYRSFELIRFCHKSGIRVTGGISKLLKAFIADFQPGDIMTYVDKDWSQDSSLKILNFQEAGQKEPMEFWINDGERYLIRSPEDRESYRHLYPKGYTKFNMGSIKMVSVLG